jgi:AmmeMemoRadiSam system protein B/AmmeMemoRadiSam system protein A
MCSMNLKKQLTMLILCLGLFANNGCSQDKPKNTGSSNDRPPSVAGKFYSGDSVELKKTIEAFFEAAVPPKNEGMLQAVIVPHAGYVFSGQVAASGFNQINPNKKYKRIFLIGSSHTTRFDGASVYAEGSFVTPLGKVPVDTMVAKDLMEKEKLFQYNKAVHEGEHSLEVELPFLQMKLKHAFSIVPIIIGGQSVETCKKLANALKPWLNEESLFVVSTDFSHYPQNIDRMTADAIITNNPDALIAAMKINESKNLPGLVTSLCGWTSVLTLMYMTAMDTSIKYVDIQYKNSSDSPYGDTNRVVGYHAIALFGKEKPAKSEFSLSAMDKENLLKVARSTITAYLPGNKIPTIDTTGFSAAIQQHCGAFVTLKKDGQLRGCIGRFTADIPLCEVVQQMAIAAATQDYRFARVEIEELSEIDIEISVLSPMKKITSVDEIQLGVHGIYMTKDGKSGTFLPQVASETGWSLEEFLGHCARDKAGIGWEGWKSAELFIYSALVFGEQE